MIEHKTIQGTQVAYKNYFLKNQNFEIFAPELEGYTDFVQMTSYRPNDSNEIKFQTGMSESDFFQDVDFIIGELSKNPEINDQLFADALSKRCQQHLGQYGRLIDTDIHGYIDVTILLLRFYTLQHHSNQIPDEICSKYFTEYLNSAIKLFEEHIYITKYDFSTGMPKPYIEKLK
jgi:hypothetical protein